MGRGIIVHENVCTGCRYCEIVCSLTHEGLVDPRKSRIKVHSDIFGGKEKVTVCRQCDPAPCVKACDDRGRHAIVENKKSGILVVDERKCNGCAACVPACPFHAIFVNEKNLAIKCDLCNGDPQCLKFCRKLPYADKPALEMRPKTPPNPNFV